MTTKHTIVDRLVRPEILKINPYQVHDATGMIKMDAMENPYLIPDELQSAWLDTIGKTEINRYPDSQARVVKQCLRNFMSIPESLSIMLGNGSDELIQIICMAMRGHNRSFLSTAPGFVMYQMITEILDTEFIAVPLNKEDFSINPDVMLKTIQEYQPAIIFIANPNNPTGNLFEQAVLDDIIDQSNGLVVIDEAYQPFSRISMLDKILDTDNLVVIRTLSKCGLAGLRLGCLIGSDAWVQQFEKIRLPYNINALSQTSAAFLLSHHSFIHQQIDILCKHRDEMIEKLQGNNHLQVWPSRTNFILFRPLKKSADDVYSGLIEKGIFIKNLHDTHPLLDQCLRVSIGTESENQVFLEVLHQLA